MFLLLLAVGLLLLPGPTAVLLLVHIIRVLSTTDRGGSNECAH